PGSVLDDGQTPLPVKREPRKSKQPLLRYLALRSVILDVLDANISVRVLHPSKTIRREELEPYQPIANLDALAERSSAKQRRRDLRFPILRRCRFPVRRSMKNRVKRMILCRDTSIRSLPVELQRQSRDRFGD